MSRDPDLLHELRTISRTLTFIHKDLQKLNTRLFITSPIPTETDKSNPVEEEPT
jgi:hypothetical protein